MIEDIVEKQNKKLCEDIESIVIRNNEILKLNIGILVRKNISDTMNLFYNLNEQDSDLFDTFVPMYLLYGGEKCFITKHMYKCCEYVVEYKYYFSVNNIIMLKKMKCGTSVINELPRYNVNILSIENLKLLKIISKNIRFIAEDKEPFLDVIEKIKTRPNNFSV